MNKPVRTCHVKTGLPVDPSERSACEGGVAASCIDYQPFVVPGTAGQLSMGFAAAAVGGASGLLGDAACGQCFELQFTADVHPDGHWGGAHPKLVGKRMVVQVTNIGYDVSGEHSFDIQVPGAGRGAFPAGCVAQFPESEESALDCGRTYGGCGDRSGCERVPSELRAGCEWRYDWLHWLEEREQQLTFNPYVRFRRVRCPRELLETSGSVSDDDADFAYAAYA